MLIAKNISCKRGKRLILNRLSLDLEPGKVTAIVGPNGSGKSTLMKVLTGELNPSEGTLLLEKRDLGDWRPMDLARIRSVLPQESTLSFAFPVIEVVMMGRTPHSWNGDRAHDLKICYQSLAKVGLENLAERSYTTLSGGEKQRVHLARVLAQIGEPPGQGRPRYLFLDEPTASLDWKHQHDALQTVRHLAREKTAVFVVLHDLNLALSYADNAFILDRGHSVGFGPCEEILTPSRIDRVFAVKTQSIQLPGERRPYIIPQKAQGNGP